MKKSIRIAVLGLRGIPDVQGGVERHCQNLYPLVSAKGAEVTILARQGYVPRNAHEYRGIRIIPLWTPRFKSLEAIFHTAFGIFWIARRRSEFDIVHIHAIGPALLSWCARKLGLRVVVTNHGPDYDRQKWGRIAKAMLRLGEKMGARHAWVMITVSKHIRQMILKTYGLHGKYIPNGVPVSERIAPGTTLSAFSLRPGKYILTVGRLVPEKGFHDLVQAFSMVSTDWNLVLVGDADHEDEYSRSLKQQAAHIPRVVMTGFQKGDALKELYANAGLFVLPSYHEGLPIVGLEAMSYDLSMLLSDIPANREIALNHELFKVGNVQMLRDKIEQFLADPGIFASSEIRQEKQHRLLTEFNWEKIAEQTLEVYQDVIKRNNE